MLAFFYLPHISHGLCLPDISIPHGLWEIDRNVIVWNCFDMEMDFIK